MNKRTTQIDKNNLIIGRAGSGKTREILIPFILEQIEDYENFIITDPKQEIYKDKSILDKLKEYGYNIYLCKFHEDSLNVDTINYEQYNKSIALFIQYNVYDNNYDKLRLNKFIYWLYKIANDANSESPITNFIFDESESLGENPYLYEVLSNSDKSKIRNFLVFQSDSQIENLYTDASVAFLELIDEEIRLSE